MMLVIASIFTITVSGQSITLEDYNRAQSFLWENTSNKSVFNLYFDGDFFVDSTGMWYKDYGPNQKDYYVLNFEDGKPIKAFNQERLADSLSAILDDTIQG